MDIFLLVTGILLIIIITHVITHIHEGIHPLSNIELDISTCDQMRDSGWTEEEIEKWMDDNGGHYHGSS